MNQHNTPINELKKNYHKMLNCDIVSKEDIEEIKNDIDDITWKIQQKIKNNPNNCDYERKQKYIESKLIPTMLLFATTYSAQLEDEYESIHSLSELSDGT